MTIAATLLSGNSESQIAHAIQGVREFVDLALLIDTGITDGTRRVAEEVLGEPAAGEGEPRQTGAGSGDPRPAREGSAGSRDPRPTREGSAGSGEPRQTGAGSGDPPPTRLIVESFAWCNDFAQARNFALHAAARHGRVAGETGCAVWAMTLDTDERMEFPGYASREELIAALESDPQVRVWLVMEKGGRYAKERFVRVGEGSGFGVQGSGGAGEQRTQDRGQGTEDRGRAQGADAPRSPDSDAPRSPDGQARRLPYEERQVPPGRQDLRWIGRVHEALVGAGQGEARILPGAFFWEVPKSPEAYAAKLARDLAILQEETRERPDDPRWWYYLGQTLAGMKRHREAADAYRRCGELPGWDEQAAWAFYKGAESLSELGEFAAAIELCARGLARQAGSPELAWLAGWCAYRRGKMREAIAWERMAIALGHVEGCRAGTERISFRHLPGWYEGPYDVLRYAHAKLGEREAAARADERFREGVAKREQHAHASVGRDTQTGSGGSRTPVVNVLGRRDAYPTGKKVLLDLGTHYGEGLRKLQPLLELDETWEIHSFEPNPACNAAERIKELGLPVQFHAAAAWTRDGTASFRQENHRQSGSGSPSDGASELDGWGSCLAEVESRHAGLERPLETPCVDLARLLGQYTAEDHVVVKMDVEGAEFALLRHVLARGVADRMTMLLVEWHERFMPSESTHSRAELRRQLEASSVQVVDWG